jgi:hypothetical protein
MGRCPGTDGRVDQEEGDNGASTPTLSRSPSGSCGAGLSGSTSRRSGEPLPVPDVLQQQQVRVEPF